MRRDSQRRLIARVYELPTDRANLDHIKEIRELLITHNLHFYDDYGSYNWY